MQVQNIISITLIRRKKWRYHKPWSYYIGLYELIFELTRLLDGIGVIWYDLKDSPTLIQQIFRQSLVMNRFLR